MQQVLELASDKTAWSWLHIALQRIQRTAFDSYPAEPFVSINPAASERQVLEALNPLMKQWKKERGLGQRRDRSEKSEQYFEVLDHRKGWQGGTYRSGEHALRETAEAFRLSTATVSKRYQ